MSDRPGYDPVLQAESGMMFLTGEPEGSPMRHALSIIDTMTGLQGVSAICAALYARRDTGRGQHIDLALMDVAVAALGNAGLYYLCSGDSPPRSGNSHMTSTPTNLFHTKTGPIYMALGSDRLFGQLCRDVLEHPEIAADPRFRTPKDRLANRPALFALLEKIFGTQPQEYWLKKMRHLPAGPVRSLRDALESEEVAARDMVTTVAHPGGERLRLLGSPLKFSHTPIRDFAPPPALGEHTDETLRRFAGCDDDTLAALRATGTIR
jgi:crotonobetainyl-CoA:carnitine CoA-transferase CaiB-like acyl-CoA transferase